MAKDNSIDLVTGRGAAPESGASEAETLLAPAKPAVKPAKKVEVAEIERPAVVPARDDADIIKGSHLVGATGVRVHNVEPGFFKVIGGNWGYKGKAYFSGVTYPIGDIPVELLKKLNKQIVVGG